MSVRAHTKVNNAAVGCAQDTNTRVGFGVSETNGFERAREKRLKESRSTI